MFFLSFFFPNNAPHGSAAFFEGESPPLFKLLLPLFLFLSLDFSVCDTIGLPVSALVGSAGVSFPSAWSGWRSG